ncbi:MAG: hypothetical protein V3V08_12215 [Nannocystaceae bacterium]
MGVSTSSACTAWLGRGEQLKLLIGSISLDRWWGWPPRAASAHAHARLGTGSGVLEVSPNLSSVASGVSRSSACIASIAGLNIPALFKQHRDASGVDDGLDDLEWPFAPRAPREVNGEDAGEEPTPTYPSRCRWHVGVDCRAVEAGLRVEQRELLDVEFGVRRALDDAWAQMRPRSDLSPR